MSTPGCSERWALLVLALAGTVVACRRAPETVEAYTVRNAVIRYNQALVEAFAASRAELMKGVATDAEITKVASIISGLASQDQYMQARQTSFTVEGSELSATQSATLDATEDWVYEHRPFDGGSAPAKRLRYRLRYHLTQAGGSWLVDRVEDLQNREPPGPGAAGDAR